MSTKVKFGLVLAAVAAVFGCAQNKPPEAPPHAIEAASIMQVGFGPSAKFVTCPLAGCSRPTPKTMAEPPSEAPAVQTSAAEPSPPALLGSAAMPAEPAKLEPPVQVNAAPAELAPPPRSFVNFPERSARLTNEAKQKLDLLVPYVIGAQRVVIKGRTDQHGNSDSNDRLAMRRALAVYDHLRHAAKTGDKRFTLLAKGACCYIARNDTEDGRAENRRAEIDFVLPTQASVATARRATNKAHSS